MIFPMQTMKMNGMMKIGKSTYIFIYKKGPYNCRGFFGTESFRAKQRIYIELDRIIISVTREDSSLPVLAVRSE